MKTAVCLQVRLDSARLPGKALLKIEDLTIIEHSMRALREVEADLFLLLTTEECLNNLTPLAEKWDFNIYGGPKEDVLLRFIQAARQFEATTLIRATGDNPLVSAPIANKVLNEHRTLKVDYSNWTGAPLGTGVEVVETASLEKALKESSEAYDHEHVTPWIYNNPNKFKLNIHSVPSEFYYESKVSVDTAEDLDKMKRIFSSLYKGQPIEIEELVNFLKQEDKTG